jgi:hypothetical protein
MSRRVSSRFRAVRAARASAGPFSVERHLTPASVVGRGTASPGRTGQRVAPGSPPAPSPRCPRVRTHCYKTQPAPEASISRSRPMRQHRERARPPRSGRPAPGRSREMPSLRGLPVPTWGEPTARERVLNLGARFRHRIARRMSVPRETGPRRRRRRHRRMPVPLLRLRMRRRDRRHKPRPPHHPCRPGKKPRLPRPHRLDRIARARRGAFILRTGPSRPAQGARSFRRARDIARPAV